MHGIVKNILRIDETVSSICARATLFLLFKKSKMEYKSELETYKPEIEPELTQPEIETEVTQPKIEPELLPVKTFAPKVSMIQKERI